MAAIRPAGRKPPVWALPKGIIDQGEKPEQAALREVTEETGIEARLVTKLGDVRYVYTWAGERVFKVVSFYLFRYSRGRLGEIAPEQRIEVLARRYDLDVGLCREKLLDALPDDEAVLGEGHLDDHG